MSNIISDAVSKLSTITEKDPLDWDAFDAILKGLEDINAYDDQYEETILSELLTCGGFMDRGEILAEVIRHFLTYGYDLSANNGMNGGLALHSLGWSSYDHKFLDAAKLLMNEGAPVNYRSRDDDPNEEPEGLLGSISWKLSGAWMVDKDYGFANTLEAYYQMTEANMAGKDYNSIDTYFTCIGKPLTAVSAVKDGDDITLSKDGILSVFSKSLVLWFGDKPLVAGCYTDYVVNPVYVDDNKHALVDVSATFSSLIGAALKKVQYIGSTICFFEFSNGMRLIFASRDIGDRKRVGTFEIRSIGADVNVENLKLECICAISGPTYASTVTHYSEDALALFCEDSPYLLYLYPGVAAKHQFRLCPCSKELISEYTRQYPIKRPNRISWIFEQGELRAARLDCSEGYFYIAATEYYDIEIQLSKKLYDPLEYNTLPRFEGIHMEFLRRKE